MELHEQCVCSSHVCMGLAWVWHELCICLQYCGANDNMSNLDVAIGRMQSLLVGSHDPQGRSSRRSFVLCWSCDDRLGCNDSIIDLSLTL